MSYTEMPNNEWNVRAKTMDISILDQLYLMDLMFIVWTIYKAYFCHKVS
jgi:hypothetical protein